MGNISDEIRLLDEEIKRIQGEIKTLEIMYEIHRLQQTLDKYDKIPVNDVILFSTEEKLLNKLEELNSPLFLNYPTVCDQLQRNNERLGDLQRSREEKLTSILQNTSQTKPEEQTPANTSQNTPEPKNVTFPLHPGAKVSDIKMMFLNDAIICITINRKSQNFNYVEMGFCRKANKEPLEMWNTLLEYAEYNGALSDVTKKKQKDSERINEKLKSFFVTDENLIVANRTVFSINKKTGKNRKPLNIQSKECPSCKETHRHFCWICNDEQEHCKECHDELYKETHADLK
ncbi:MAG: hypothetical protein HUT38_04600 [Candidatus Paceibacter sp.]|nr:hypothetical protein [Candidatus Paceibacter sp.]